MKNYSKYICLFLLLIGMSTQSIADSWTWTYASGDQDLFGIATTVKGKTVLNGKTWSFTRTGANNLGFENSCVQFGKNGGVETVVLSTNSICGTITQVDVVCASYNAKHKCKIEVGGSTVKEATATASGSANAETISSGIISKTGEIKITLAPGSGARAAYIKSISVTYTSSSYNVDWYVGGSKVSAETSVTVGTPPTVADNALGGDCSSLKFLGWSKTDIGGTPSSAPSDLFVSEDAPALSENTEYHAVFGELSHDTDDSILIQTHRYDSWTFSAGTGATTDKSTYRIFGNGSYVQSTAFRLEGLASVVVCGGTFGGTSYNGLAIKDTDGNSWKTGTVSNTTKTNPNVISNGASLSGRKAIRVYSTSGNGNDGVSGNGVGISRVLIFSHIPEYSNCVTTCVTCSDEPLVGDAALESITAGTISVSCDAIVNGDGCATEEYGFVWKSGASAPTSTSDGTKVKVGDDDSGDSGFSRDLSISFTTGTTYQIVAYATNGAGTTLGDEVAVTPQSITFNSNGGSSVSTIYVQSGTAASAPTAPTKDGYVFGGWYQESGLSNEVNWSATISADKTYYAKWRPYVDYRFSCAELTLTSKLVTAGTPIFITSTGGKKVRSQDSILIVGNGLTPSQTLEFPNLPSQFEIKSGTNGTLAVAADGTINAVAYVYYTPDAGTTDILNTITGITVKVGGTKPLQKTLTQDIIGRRLPEKFVIAAKRNNKWYALPDTMTVVGTPKPIEIAVDDIDNPSIAYTSADTKFSIEGPSSGNLSGGVGQYVKLVMNSLWSDDSDHTKGHAPLFGSTTKTAKIGKSGNSQATNPLSKGWWWQLIQKNTSITNPQDAKYQIFCANNDTTLSLKENAGNPIWGLYKSGIDELRLIPASSVGPTEAYFVEWSQHGGVVEVDATGIDATSVVAHLGAANSSAITLSQTLTSGKSKPTIYNYTVNFGDAIDFAAAASNGAMLTLEWKKGDAVKAMSNIVVPKIIATSATMKSVIDTDDPWSKAEVHVLPGVTLTANAGDFKSNDVTIKHLEIYPGATVKVTKGEAAGGTLQVNNLVLRNGWSRAGTKTYDVARMHIGSNANLTHTNAYADWYIDYDQYYPIAVPWDVTVASITYRYSSISSTFGYDQNIRLRYYDGSQRVSGGTSSWKSYGASGAESVPTTLKPSQGYAITAKRPAGKAFAILRMPLTFADTWTTGGEQGRYGEEVKDTVHVIAHGVGANPAKPWYAVGWNFIGNPYMSCFDSNESDFMNKLIAENGGSVKYATIPDTEFEGFDQVNIASVGNKLKPSSGFFVQVGTTGSLQFKQGKIITPSAPARYTKEQEAIPEQEAYIQLNGEQGHDQMGLIIGSDYTEDYEMNADLSKMLGNANIVKTWMRYTDMDMAYVAINEQLAREWIPVTVHIPAEGEYTYSLKNGSTVDELEGLYLIDHETGAVTNLLYNDYTFSAEAGTNTERFAINAIAGERKVPTSADITGVDKNSNEPVKFIWHDKVFILHNNVIYDSTGKRVNEINK